MFIDTEGNAAAAIDKKFGKNNFRRQKFGQIYTRIILKVLLNYLDV